MLNQERISIGKLKQAYELNSQDVISLIAALWPDRVFPYELWQNAYSLYWEETAITLAKRHNMDPPPCPQVVTEDMETVAIEAYANNIVHFLIDVSFFLRGHNIKDGLDYITDIAYEQADCFLHDEIELFAGAVGYGKERMRQFNYPIADWRNHGPSSTLFDLFVKRFPDTIVVDKSAAVRHLFDWGYPLRHEVKGISHALVARFTTTPVAAALPNTAEESQIADYIVPKALWKGKLPSSVRDAMRKEEYPEAVIAFVLHKKHGIDKTRIGKTLGKPDRSDSTYLRLATQLLEEAADLAIITDPASESAHQTEKRRF
jgi:hypothetical protein